MTFVLRLAIRSIYKRLKNLFQNINFILYKVVIIVSPESGESELELTPHFDCRTTSAALFVTFPCFSCQTSVLIEKHIHKHPSSSFVGAE